VKSPLAWFRDLFARKGQDPVQIARYVLPYPVAGVNLLPDEILSLATVWACIDAIARAIGQCSWNVYRPLGEGRRELLANDNLMWLLNTRPNPEMTAIGFREAMLFRAFPYGNAYAEIVRDAGGRVAELWPLPSDRVTPRRDPATWELFYDVPPARRLDGPARAAPGLPPPRPGPLRADGREPDRARREVDRGGGSAGAVHRGLLRPGCEPGRRPQLAGEARATSTSG
jgi:hypothetical protein